MRYPTNKVLGVVAASLAIATTLLTGCGASMSSQSGQSEAAGSQSISEATEKVLMGEGVVSKFISQKFYDKKVTNENEALEAVKSAYSSMGADDSVVLDLNAVRPVEGGNTYYIFQQKAGETMVYGASVKLVVNKDNDVVALSSSILPNVKAPELTENKIDAKKAEEIVVNSAKEKGGADAKVVPDSTEQTLITLPGTKDRYAYAWVVYTQNYLVDSEKDMAYLAHYVDAQGK